MNILIICDEPGSGEPLQTMLEQAGYSSVRLVGGPQAGLEELGITGQATPAEDVSLIVIEFTPPGTDELEVCRRIKGEPRLADIPIIVLNTDYDTAILRNAFEAGVTDYLAGPLRPDEFLARARAALNLHAEREQRKQRERELLEKTRQLEAAHRELQLLATLDPLTGIANRRTFEDFLEVEWRRAVRNRASISLLIVDVDWFKAYNDHYGHQAGDICLRRIATTLSDSLNRPGDLASRFGGEEFAVVLPDTDDRGAYFVGERLRRRIESLAIMHPASVISSYVTISVGTATRQPQKGDSTDEMITAADNALYRGKQRGRNQVIPAP
ncbi:MAG: diguanylate cyclase [Chloroflexi bacterium]|nr:diguanylate cyclase [Chloroflexota bacterium]